MSPLNHLAGSLVRPVMRRVRPERAALESMQLCVDRAWYLAIYPDVVATGLDAVEHFVRRGAYEGRRPNRFFDPIWYAQRYGDAAGQLPILHYATKGRRKGYDPGPGFSAGAYLKAHPDVAASGIDPLDHYVLHGQHEKRAVEPADTSWSHNEVPCRSQLLFPKLSEDELPGRERLARVQETFALRDIGVGYRQFAEANIVAFQAPPPPPPAIEVTRGSPFWFYNCFLNAEGTIIRHARKDLTPHPDYLTNFLGVKLAPRFIGGAIDDREGQIEAPPLPSNWHSDLTEWTAVLRAIDLAGSRFTMVELGCTWACWMSNAGAAARKTARTNHLIGVEGAKRMTFAEEMLETNGFAKSDYILHRGEPGKAADTAAFLRDNSRIDLLHINIRGCEADYVRDKLTELGDRVAYLAICTHSREAEGDLFSTLRAAGWCLEIERPAYLHLEPESAPAMKIHGAQGWRNMKLLCNEQSSIE